MKWVNSILVKLESQVLKPSYPYVLGAVALIDNFIFLIPIAAILVTSVLTARKRWFPLALWTAIGSSIGAILFSLVIFHFGISIIETFTPGLMTHRSWHEASHLINEYGTWALFLVCALPISEHVIIVLAVLAKIPLTTVAFGITAGKLVKFFALSYLASHAPNVLLKLKWLKKDLKQVQTEIQNENVKEL